MFEENISQELRLENIHETRNYLIGKLNQNKLMSKKYKKVYRVLNYIEDLLISISAVSGYVSISAFTSLVGILIRITSSAIGLKICLITAGIKKCKSIIKKKKKNHDKILSLAKSKLNSVEVVISKALIDSNINHDKFVLINYMLKTFREVKEEMNNSNDK